MNDTETFWIVLRDAQKPNATVRHDTQQAAKAECARLAAKHQDVFYVFRVALEGCMVPQEPEWRAA